MLLMTLCRSEIDYDDVVREIEVHFKACLSEHPGICQLFSVFEDDDSVYMVMEFASGGDLNHFMESRNGLSEKQMRTIFVQLVDALQHLQSIGIAHCDIKLEVSSNPHLSLSSSRQAMTRLLVHHFRARSRT